ncbi:hypothetical protein M436DRAFT_62126 [Aureobasidium namibiae CBS 147.97]|uniref:4Fe-4S ferredoxin-type domain-containing protein n=1 Tax=Aureobasidium namibiae CBS 147.97 TaxID=1043004 RepID=A0A074WY45_9PEZI
MRSTLWISVLALFAAVTIACDDSQRQNCAECRNGCSNTCAPNGGDSGAGAFCSGCLLGCLDLCGDCDDEGISQSCSSVAAAMAIAMVQVGAQDTAKAETRSVPSASISAAAQTLDVAVRTVVIVLRLVENAMQIMHTSAVLAILERNAKAGSIGIMFCRSTAPNIAVYLNAVAPVPRPGFDN